MNMITDFNLNCQGQLPAVTHFLYFFIKLYTNLPLFTKPMFILTFLECLATFRNARVFISRLLDELFCSLTSSAQFSLDSAK